MLISMVFLVSVNILMVKTENGVVKVTIEQDTQSSYSCKVHKENELTLGTNFTLEVSSDFFIMESIWMYNDVKKVLENLKTSTISLTYNKTHNKGTNPKVTLKYYYSRTQVFHNGLVGNWNFSFNYLKNYDPWSRVHETSGHYCNCSTSAEYPKSSHPASRHGIGHEGSDPSKSGGDGQTEMPTWVIYVLSAFGLFCVVQSSYIIYGKVKGRRTKRDNDKDPISPKSPKGKRSKTTRNIADRPPLPLPSEAVIPTPPQPPISPGPVHKHLFPTAPPMPVENPYSAPSDPVPLVSKPSYRHKGLDTCHEGVISPVFDRKQQGPSVPQQSYRNKALVASVEELRSPGFPRRHMDGPLVPNLSFKNKALDASLEELRRTPGCPRRYMDDPIVPKLTYRKSVCLSDDSDEEHKSPGFARRQIEAKFARIPPKGVAPSKSFKLPRPLPRSPPSPTLERVPPFNPAHRPEPVPPLHPKKLPVFPPPAPFRKQEPSRMSDDEWQYEQLQPLSKYLDNNFSTTNNYNR